MRIVRHAQPGSHTHEFITRDNGRGAGSSQTQVTFNHTTMEEKTKPKEVPEDQQSEQPDTAELLREIAKDKKKIRQLNTAKSRIDKAIKAIRAKVDENETLVYQQYEPTEPIQAEETLKQLELF